MAKLTTGKSTGKLTWPKWDELKGSTFIVISFSILISVFLFFIDRILSTVLQVVL